MVEAVLSENFVNRINYNCMTHQGSNHDWGHIFRLNRSVQIEHPSYDGPLLSPETLENGLKLIHNDNRVEPSVRNALETVLGGPSYLLSRLFTKLGHYIGKKVSLDLLQLLIV